MRQITRLYFLRHGIAEDPSPGTPDHARQLTAEGIEQARAEAARLKQMKLKLDLIVSSPLPRARETADIVAEALDVTDRVREDARLAGGFGLGDLQAIVRENPHVERLMLVGHEPGFSTIAGQLVGGASIDLKKGGLIRIEIDRIEPEQGVLEWLLTPAVLIKD